MFTKKMLAEATTRMKLLGIDGPTICRFQDTEKIPVYATGEEQGEVHVLEASSSLPEGQGVRLVYAIVDHQNEFAKTRSFLYINSNADEWELQRADAERGIAMSFTKNLTAPELSEYGPVCISMDGTSLIRVS